MITKINEPSPWGEYAPHGLKKLLLLPKKIGLSHGPIKKIIGRLWQKLLPGLPVDVTYHHVKFRLHPWDNATEAKILMGSGQRDREELKSIRNVVSAGGIFVDIGANVGYYSLMAASFGAKRVLAIEPGPLAYSRLQFNITANRLNDKIVSLPVALGERSEKTTLYVTEDEIGGSTISLQEVPGKPVSVSMRPLAEIMVEQNIEHIDALKIDTEGMEDLILFPFYESTSYEMWPKLVIIEHTSQRAWKRDILAWMLESNYHVVGKTRSNMILKLG